MYIQNIYTRTCEADWWNWSYCSHWLYWHCLKKSQWCGYGMIHKDVYTRKWCSREKIDKPFILSDRRQANRCLMNVGIVPFRNKVISLPPLPGTERRALLLAFTKVELATESHIVSMMFYHSAMLSSSTFVISCSKTVSLRLCGAVIWLFVNNNWNVMTLRKSLVNEKVG